MVPRRPTEIILLDWTDLANGTASTLPINTIFLYVGHPHEDSTLSLYEDWLDGVLTHEYAHILHLDQVAGVQGILRKLVGRIIAPNQVSPGWIVEGQATWHESRMTPGGRGRASQADMLLRMAALEGKLPALGALDATSGPPGNARHVFGRSFMDYIAQHSSEDA